MATKNLSIYDQQSVPDGDEYSVGIVVSEWNREVTEALLDGALTTLNKHGVSDENIAVEFVPGTFELTFGASAMMYQGFDAIIVLGCVIRGETPHFDYVCQGVTQGITKLNADGETPVIFGVLTTDNLQQALDRAGGKLGNKGDEAAVAALKMIEFNFKYNPDYQDDDDEDDTFMHN